ncbi:MAG: NAD(P)-dependent oxidoreductase [Desulfobulbaceae bacterium]|nr:NAD(P)-dependent oxidoreductase [Desulfobulbaceae bacterium]
MGEHRKTKIGFIGLGLMGAAMVQRLQDLGYPIELWSSRVFEESFLNDSPVKSIHI